MGNANGKVYNDTGCPQKIYVFNYADGLRSIARDEFTIAPGATQKVEAAAHGSGLIVATGKGSKGHHTSVANGTTLNISTLLECGGNSWHGVCKALTITGVAVGGVAVGALTGGALAGPAAMCVVGGEAASTAVVTAAACAGGTMGGTAATAGAVQGLAADCD